MAHVETGLNTVSLVPFSTRPSRFRTMAMVGSIISNASNKAERQRNGDADLSSFLVGKLLRGGYQRKCTHLVRGQEVRPEYDGKPSGATICAGR